MHNWRLLLLLIFNLLHLTLSEHNVVDGRQCCSHSSRAKLKDEKASLNGRYGFDTPIFNNLLLNDLREIPQNDRRSERHHEATITRVSRERHDARVTGVSHNDRLSFREREIREVSQSRQNQTVISQIPQSHRTDIRERENDVDRKSLRTSNRNVKISRSVFTGEIKYNGNDDQSLRRNVRKRDLTESSDKAHSRTRMTANQREQVSISDNKRSIRQNNRNMATERNIVLGQYEATRNHQRENRGIANNAEGRQERIVFSTGDINRRYYRQIKDQHISSRLDRKFNSFERDFRQRVNDRIATRDRILKRTILTESDESETFARRGLVKQIAKSRTEQNQNVRYERTDMRNQRTCARDTDRVILLGDNRHEDVKGNEQNRIENVRVGQRNIRHTDMYERYNNIERAAIDVRNVYRQNSRNERDVHLLMRFTRNRERSLNARNERSQYNHEGYSREMRDADRNLINNVRDITLCQGRQTKARTTNNRQPQSYNREERNSYIRHQQIDIRHTEMHGDDCVRKSFNRIVTVPTSTRKVHHQEEDEKSGKRLTRQYDSLGEKQRYSHIQDDVSDIMDTERATRNRQISMPMYQNVRQQDVRRNTDRQIIRNTKNSCVKDDCVGYRKYEKVSKRSIPTRLARIANTHLTRGPEELNANEHDIRTDVRENERNSRNNIREDVAVENERFLNQYLSRNRERQDISERNRLSTIKNNVRYSRDRSLDRMYFEQDLRRHDTRKMPHRHITNSRPEINSNVRDERTRAESVDRHTNIRPSVSTETRDAERYTRENSRDSSAQRVAKRISDVARIRKERSTVVNIDLLNRDRNLKETIRRVNLERSVRHSGSSTNTDRYIADTRGELNTVERVHRAIRNNERASRENVEKTADFIQRDVRYLDARSQIARTRGKRTIIISNHININTNERRSRQITERPIPIKKHSSDRRITDSRSREERYGTVSNERSDIRHIERNSKDHYIQRVNERNTRQTDEENLDGYISLIRDIRNNRKRFDLRDSDRFSGDNTRERILVTEQRVQKSFSRINVGNHIRREKNVDKREQRVMMNNDKMSYIISPRERTRLSKRYLDVKDERARARTNVRNTQRIATSEHEISQRNTERATHRHITPSIDERIIKGNRISEIRQMFDERQIRERRQMRDTTQRRELNVDFSRSMTELYTLPIRKDMNEGLIRHYDPQNRQIEENLQERGSTSGIRREKDDIRFAYRNPRNYVERERSQRTTDFAYRRNAIGPTKVSVYSTESADKMDSTFFYWQYLFYTVQGIYIFGIFLQIFREKGKDAKIRPMSWLTTAQHIKVD